MGSGDWFLIGFIIVALIGVGLYYLNRWASKKMAAQNTMINSMKQSQTAYIIDKKKDKITNVNMPSMVIDQIPKYQKYMNMYFVKAKIGPQIVTLMCDKNVFQGIPVKKSIKIELAGIYVVSYAGMKTKEELKALKKEKKEKAKAKETNKK